MRNIEKYESESSLFYPSLDPLSSTIKPRSTLASIHCISIATAFEGETRHVSIKKISRNAESHSDYPKGSITRKRNESAQLDRDSHDP